jgi:putative transposase
MAKAQRKYTDEHFVSILQEHHGGATAAKEIIRRLGISRDTFYRWKRKYTGLGQAELQRPKALEDENGGRGGWRPTRP